MDAYFKRQIQMPEIGAAGQDALRKASVLVVGMGGLGCPLAQYLAAAGVGTLHIYDFDTVDESNLHRQLLYTRADLGKNKAQTAATVLQSQFPHTRVEAHGVAFSPAEAETVMPTVDLVVDCTDQIAVKYMLEAVCSHFQKPWIYAAVSGFELQWALFAPNELSYSHIFPEPPNPMFMPNCEVNGTIGVVPGTAAMFQASLAIQHICGLYKEQHCIHILDMLSWRSSRIEVEQPKAIVKEEWPSIKATDYTKKILDFHYKKKAHG